MNRLSREIFYGTLVFVLGMLVMYVTIRWKHVRARPFYVKRKRLDRYRFKTGDLVLTSDDRSRNGFSPCNPAWLIKLFTGSAVNHTAVAYVDEATGQTLFWEMNGSGTRLATLSDLTSASNDHHIVVRPLNKGVDQGLFESVMMNRWSCIFDWDMGLSWYDRFLPAPFLPVPFVKGHRWGGGIQWTCAGLTSELYHALGVLDFRGTGIDPGSLFAADYAREGIETNMLPLSNGYRFEPPILLLYEKTSRSSDIEKSGPK